MKHLFLQNTPGGCFCWFEMNYMKLNTDNCHPLISRNKNEQMWVKLNRDIVRAGDDAKLLGITLENNLKFDKHVANICSKANRKLSALTRVAKFLLFKKRRILFEAFIESQFNYCLFVWIFQGRQINDKINKLHERALSMVYNDTIKSLNKVLLAKIKLLLYIIEINHLQSKCKKL